MSDDPWTPEYNVNDLGFQLGYISSLNSQKRRKKKHPLGFAACAPPRKPRNQRKPGTFPEVPKFDVPQEPGGDQ